MMKKTCLCILGLLLMGMLCVPVAATAQRPGYWNFDIVNGVTALSEVKLNGDGNDGDAYYQSVYVSDALDQIEMEVKVTAGPDTTLTITKDYITTLRKGCPGWEPTLVADGSFLTYDVDAVCIDTRQTVSSTLPIDTYEARIYEHLKKRGLVHHPIGITYYFPCYTTLVERSVES